MDLGQLHIAVMNERENTMVQRNFTLLLVLCTCFLAGCATNGDTPPRTLVAELGHAGDSITTYIGIASGSAQEGNPLLRDVVGTGYGDLAVLAYKAALINVALYLPPQECRIGYSVMTGLGWGLTTNNVIVLAAGVGGPVALGAGAAVGILTSWLTYEHAAEQDCANGPWLWPAVQSQSTGDDYVE